MTLQELQQQALQLPPHERRQLAAILQDSLTPTQTPQPLNLQNQPFVGMWRDRPETQNSTTWVRGLRRQQWPRHNLSRETEQ
ncbi:MAG: hypothetical protein ACFB9N_15550 [Geitlerinemataceae cyanobacterium]